MANFDGSAFVGLDSDILGDGGGDTLPVDSLLEAGVRANNIHLIQGLDAFTWTPPTAGVGVDHRDKTMCRTSLDWTTIAPPMMMPILPGMSGLRIRGLVRVGDESEGNPATGETEDFELRFELKGFMERRVDVPSSLTTTPAWQDLNVDLNFNETVNAPMWIPFIVWGRGVPTNTVGAGTFNAQTYPKNVVKESGGSYGLYGAESGTHPNTTSLGLMCTEFVDTVGGTRYFDHLYYKASTDEMTVQPVTPPSSGTGEVYFMNYLQVAGLCIQPLWDFDRPGRHAPQPISEIRPKISNTATTWSKHASNADYVQRRRSILHWGPWGTWGGNGGSTKGGTSDFNNVCYWPYVDGDLGREFRLDDAWLMSHHDTGTIRVDLMLIATHLTDAFWYESTFEELLEASTPVNWDITARVEQLADGDADWDAATSLAAETRTVTMTAKPTSMSGIWPFLHQMALSRFGQAAATNDYSHSRREGQLWEADLGLVEFVTFNLELSGDHDPSIPIRITAEAELNAVPTYWNFKLKNSLGPGQTSEFLRLSLVGSTFSEVP